MEKLMIDSDIFINWLTQEEETATGRSLWIAPSVILEMGENQHLKNYTSLLSLFEIRYVLRRKKRIDFSEIEQDLHAIQRIVRCLTPDSEELKEANRLQSEQSLDPFDSILLAQTIKIQGILISRDQRFLQIAREFVEGFTPEGYVERSLS